MISLRLFLRKLKNRLRFALDIKDIIKQTKLQKQSCQRCGVETWIDFSVTDEEWKRFVPEKWQNTALCINCFLYYAPMNFKISEFELLHRVFVEKK